MNWFRTDANGKFIWPGFSQNMRVLEWIVRRIEGAAGGVEHTVGISPRYEDLRWDGLAFSRNDFENVSTIDAADWRTELSSHRELFDKLHDRLPSELEAVRQRWSAGLSRAA